MSRKMAAHGRGRCLSSLADGVLSDRRMRGFYAYVWLDLLDAIRSFGAPVLTFAAALDWGSEPRVAA
jgi:hypothetical protein